MGRCAAVVLAGGASRRFGADKLAVHSDGQTLLEAALGGLPADADLVVVGPRRPVGQQVRFVREDPPGGGPAAGLVAGLAAVLAGEYEEILVLPGDSPGAGEATALLRAELGHHSEGVLGTDVLDRPQPLQLALTPAVAAELLRVAGPGAGRNVSARRLVESLQPPLFRVALPTRAHFDVDTPVQLLIYENRRSPAVEAVLAAVAGSSRPVCVLAVDGPSTAATSILAQALALRRPAAVINTDDFRDPRVLALTPQQRSMLTDAEVADAAIDWRRLRREALEPLRRGGLMAGRSPLVGEAPLLVVAGPYSARPELSDLLDLTVLVRADSQQAGDVGGSPAFWARGERYYFTRVRPERSFDLVLRADQLRNAHRT